MVVAAAGTPVVVAVNLLLLSSREELAAGLALGSPEGASEDLPEMQQNIDFRNP